MCDIADAENAAESARKLSVHAGRNSHAVRLYTELFACVNTYFERNFIGD